MPSSDTEKLKKLDQLLQAFDKAYLSMPHLLWRSFLSGLVSGLGATIGASLVVGALTYIVAKLANIIP